MYIHYFFLSQKISTQYTSIHTVTYNIHTALGNSMGNCLRKTSSIEWGGEDWGSFGSGDRTRIHRDTQGGSSEGDSKTGLSNLLAAGGTEVKIKISRRELEKVLKEADIDGLPVQQVVARLMNAGDEFKAHQRSWRPALHSIPE